MDGFTALEEETSSDVISKRNQKPTKSRFNSSGLRTPSRRRRWLKWTPMTTAGIKNTWQTACTCLSLRRAPPLCRVFGRLRPADVAVAAATGVYTLVAAAVVAAAGAYVLVAAAAAAAAVFRGPSAPAPPPSSSCSQRAIRISWGICSPSSARRQRKTLLLLRFQVVT